MISKLPRWVESGAFTLALVAGIVNAVGLLGFQHQSISHLSGTATLLGAAMLNEVDMIIHLAGILVSFMMGAAVSGLLLSDTPLKLGRDYDSLLCIEGLLLLLAIYFLYRGSVAGHYFASAACGLQNALATTFSGAIIRTTHVTGIFTDLGIMLGAMLRGQKFDRRKAILFLLIISGFILGGTLGAFLYGRLQFMALAVPVMICFVLAGAYRNYRKRMNH